MRGIIGESASWTTLNRVAVGAVEQDNPIRGAVDDHRKQVQNVAAKYAHVQGILPQARRVRAAKGNPLAVVSLKADFRRYINRFGDTANAAESVHSRSVLECQLSQSIRANHGAVSTGIQQQINLSPEAVTAKNLG